MLPFLKPKAMSSTIMARRGKPGLEVANEVDAPGTGESSSLEDAAADVLAAIDTRSPKDLAAALRRAFEACESEPHAEGPHTMEGDKS